jgi:hypothetical protein
MAGSQVQRLAGSGSSAGPWSCRGSAAGDLPSKSQLTEETKRLTIGDCVVLFRFKIVVKDDERAFPMRDGRFERLLGPGRFVALDYGRRLTAETVKVASTEIAADRALLFAKAHPALGVGHFEIVQAGANERAIVSLDGERKHLVLPNTTRAFWKTITRVEVDRIDATTELSVAKRHLDKLDPARTPDGRADAGGGARGRPSPANSMDVHGMGFYGIAIRPKHQHQEDRTPGLDTASFASGNTIRP